MAASEKLSHLLQLAEQGPALRAALAEEVAELVAHWPSDYPGSMRSVCESLLTDAAHDADLAHRVLPRAQALVDAARNGQDLTAALAQSLGVNETMARQILNDDSGSALAVACKGAHIGRAAFSALALLTRPRRDRSHAFAVLDVFDNVPESEATTALRGWRENNHAA